MNKIKLAIGLMASTAAAMAQAASTGPAELGVQAPLPLVEGGLLTVGVIALVAGVRAIQRKNKR